MSKRNRKKLKRILRAQAEQNVSRVSEVNLPEGQLETPKQEVIPEAPTHDPEIEEPEEVKREITKILITVIILVLIVVAIYFINTKTDLVLKMGEFIASKFNLSI
jgi:hypothetical protein